MANTVATFTKNITSADVHSMCLPVRFCKKFGHELPTTVSVEFPDGLSWTVGVGDLNVTSAKGRVEKVKVFDGDWTDIAAYYGVGEGFIAHCEYRGENGFFVLFFVNPRKEIKYPSGDSSSDSSTDLIAATDVFEDVSSDEDDTVQHSCRSGCFSKKFTSNDKKKMYLRKGFLLPSEYDRYDSARVYMKGHRWFTECALKHRVQGDAGELLSRWGYFVMFYGIEIGDVLHFSAERDAANDVLKVIVSLAG